MSENMSEKVVNYIKDTLSDENIDKWCFDIDEKLQYYDKKKNLALFFKSVMMLHAPYKQYRLSVEEIITSSNKYFYTPSYYPLKYYYGDDIPADIIDKLIDKYQKAKEASSTQYIKEQQERENADTKRMEELIDGIYIVEEEEIELELAKVKPDKRSLWDLVIGFLKGE